MQLVRAYIDHEKVGCGWRFYLVFPAGKRASTVRWLSTATAATFKLTKLQSEIVLKHAVLLPLNCKRTRRRLRAVAKTYGLEKSKTVKDALAALALGELINASSRPTAASPSS